MIGAMILQIVFLLFLAFYIILFQISSQLLFYFHVVIFVTIFLSNLSTLSIASHKSNLNIGWTTEMDFGICLITLLYALVKGSMFIFILFLGMTGIVSITWLKQKNNLNYLLSS